MIQRLTRGAAADAGFGLIEVIVAILVLAIISTGIVASMSTIMQMTHDNSDRITAANLATQDLDLVRAIADPYQISDSVTTSSPDASSTNTGATVFTVTRTVSWVSSAGADVSCNSSTNLFYLRVNVRVTWSGMLSTTKPVQDDTVIAPSDASSNAETGAVSISVTGADGSPVAGVKVTLTPTSGGSPLTTQPKNTTAGGCTYANQVVPGTYNVTITKAGYINDSQDQSPTKSVVVAAGATTSAPFTFDKLATYLTSYTPGPATGYTGPTVNLPSNLPTNFISGGTWWTTNAPASSKQLFPFSSGYSATTGFAGDTTTGCASVDPANWAGGTSNGFALRDGVRASAGAAPGGSASLVIPIGVVKVRAPSGATLTATEATPQGAGNPGCAVTGKVLTWTVTGSGGWVALALPYGSWTVKANGVALGAADLQISTNVAPSAAAADGTVTLDPRK